MTYAIKTKKIKRIRINRSRFVVPSLTINDIRSYRPRGFTCDYFFYNFRFGTNFECLTLEPPDFSTLLKPPYGTILSHSLCVHI